MSAIDFLKRGQAAELLQQFSEAAALGDLLAEEAAQVLGELHPATVERLRRISALTACCEALLRARAGQLIR